MVAVLDATSLSLRLPPDQLILVSGDTGDTLEFLSSQPLQETTWLLQEITKAPQSADTVTMWLGNGAVSGEGPCGPYAGRYATEGMFITFTELGGSGASDCQARTPERDLLRALRRSVLLGHVDGDLLLLDAAGKVLVRFSHPGAP